jgi:hypothetical protein
MSDSVSSETDDARIRAVVTRLARRRAEGGHVIERAAILAAGSDSAAIETWILDHAGRPEQPASTTATGLHAHRLTSASASNRSPRRFLLPPGALDADRDRSD